MTKDIRGILKNHSNDYSELESEFYKRFGGSFIYDSFRLDDLKIKPLLSASVVIPAWNAEDTIFSCITAIEKSSFNQKYPESLQVVVTDDGSTDRTLEILKDANFNLNLIVVHQDNHSQGPAMNAGISVAEGDIIIETDADTVLNLFAIENLMVRHEFHKNALYTGFRTYVDKKDTRVTLDYLRKNGPSPEIDFSTDERIKYFTPGWPSSMAIASNNYKRLGNLKGLWMPEEDNDDPWILADMVFGMTFSLSRDIFKVIGGFDDRFKGWGCDDGYVGVKAISTGIFVIPVYPATGLHISHPFRTKDKQSEYDFNRKFFFEFINSTEYEGYPDWISKANLRIKEKIVRDTKRTGEKNDLIEVKPLETKQMLQLGRYNEVYNLSKNCPDTNTVRSLMGLGRYKEAVDLFELLREKTDMDTDVMFDYAVALASLGMFTESGKAFEEISRIDPNYPELEYWVRGDVKTIYKQGIKYFEEEFYDLAKRCFEAVLTLDGNSTDARNYREKCIKNL